MFLAWTLIFLASLGQADSLPKSIYRYDYNNDGLSTERHPIQRITLGSQEVEAYVYEDLTFPNGESPQVTTSEMAKVAALFTTTVYPKFVEEVTGDPRSRQRGQHPIILLFDNIHDKSYYANQTKKNHPAMYFGNLNSLYQRDILIVDINYLNLYYARILLGHELSHLIRNIYNSSEATWLDEGLAKYIESFLADDFPIYQLQRYLKNPSEELQYDFL